MAAKSVKVDNCLISRDISLFYVSTGPVHTTQDKKI